MNLPSPIRPEIYLLFIIAAGVTLPGLVQDGMFMDGVIYATVAKHLANGVGNFWDLRLWMDPLSHYRDQPPLTIWITSFFFTAFGNSLYVERFYSFLTLVICVLLVGNLWKTIYRDEKKQLWWIPALWFVITPIVNWSFRNNMQENTMTIFVLLASKFAIDALYNNRKLILNGVLSGIFIFLSFMCKGVQGSFPIVIPVIYVLVFKKNYSRSGVLMILSVFVITTFSTLLYFYEPSRNYFTGYYQTRIFPTFNYSKVATTSNRLFLIYRIVGEILVGLGIILSIFFIDRKINLKNRNVSFESDRKSFVFFLLIALAGSIPLLVTFEQRSWYLIPSFPFYILAFCSLFSDRLRSILNPSAMNNRLLFIVNICLLVFVVSVSAFLFGKTTRHNELLEDIYKVAEKVPTNSVIEASNDQYLNFSLPLYFERYFNIDVKIKEDTLYSNKYFLKSLTDKKEYSDKYSVEDIHLNNFILMK